ncbi:MAG: S8 family serine peptidase, partial [Dermatophilaceae bacterium]
GDPSGSPARWTRMSGTSMAAPHVAGAIACLLGVDGPTDAARVRARLLACCRPYRGPEPVRAGAGSLDVRALLGPVVAGHPTVAPAHRESLRRTP